MLKMHTPKFLYEYQSSQNSDHIFVMVYEEFEKQYNSSITLTVVFESLAHQNNIYLKKIGGRRGFRGNSFSEEKSATNDVVDFILDYAKRHGLTLQEEKIINEGEH